MVYPPAVHRSDRIKTAHQEDGGSVFTTCRFTVQVVVVMSVHRACSVFDPGIARRVDWLERHDAMGGKKIG
jgi:hypothetical protein